MDNNKKFQRAMKLLCIFILVVVIQPCAFFIIPRTINQKVDIYLYATLKLNFTNIRKVDMASPHSDKVRDTKSSPFKNRKKKTRGFHWCHSEDIPGRAGVHISSFTCVSVN